MDLGATPLANAYLSADALEMPEPYYPLRCRLCATCGLVQLDAVVSPQDIFGNYQYFSSFSSTLAEHSKAFVRTVTARGMLEAGGLVVEIASNDGYLLRFFRQGGFDVLGVEPAANIAAAAEAAGIPTISRFFGVETARELVACGRRPRFVVANNVVAHVPDLSDFLSGLKILLAPGGTISLEFHHLLSIVQRGQFDTIYHEHFQYFSLESLRSALAAHGMTVVDVDTLPTQGGSLRVYARHLEDVVDEPPPAVVRMLAIEREAGLTEPATYRRLASEVFRIKLDLLSFLVEARRAGKAVVCFGAAAKGTSLLNYCGVHADLVDYAVDSSPHKQGLFLPGSRIPIASPDRIAETRPDYVLILPWNLRDEITQQMAHIRQWGGRFVVPVPELQVFDHELAALAQR